MTANFVSEKQDALKNKEPIARNKIHSSKSYLSRNSKPVLVKKQSGIQLKSGSVFCLPAKSSHSSRIIIPNKRFLEDDYCKVEISPKKPKTEPSLSDAKKASTISVPSTYKCPLGAKKQLKSDNEDTALDVARKPDIGAERDPCESESTQTKDSTSDVDKQDTKMGLNNNEVEIVTVQAVDGHCLKEKLTTESTESISITSSSGTVALTGSILQRPKLCLDQSAVDRSKLAFADSLRNQIAQESQPDISNTVHVGDSACSLPAAGDAEVHGITTSASSSNNIPSVTCRNWNTSTGKCHTLYCVVVTLHPLHWRFGMKAEASLFRGQLIDQERLRSIGNFSCLLSVL